jgi:electron transfer flavoprotein beta subunit
MKIVVAVKQVLVLDGELALRDNGAGVTVDADAMRWELNEWDAFAVDAALRIHESPGGGDDEVVALTVGDVSADQVLLTCLAMGADRAIRLWDPLLQDADSLAVARVLADVVRAEHPDLVLCGAQSADMASGATGVALAGLLDLPRVAVARSVRCEAGAAVVERELAGGMIEVLRVPIPAVITIQTGVDPPRHPTLRQIKQAPQKPRHTVGLNDFDLQPETVMRSAGSRTVRLSVPIAGRAQMLDGSSAAVAQRIIALVQERLGT